MRSLCRCILNLIRFICLLSSLLAGCQRNIQSSPNTFRAARSRLKLALVCQFILGAQNCANAIILRLVVDDFHLRFRLAFDLWQQTLLFMTTVTISADLWILTRLPILLGYDFLRRLAIETIEVLLRLYRALFLGWVSRHLPRIRRLLLPLLLGQ